MTKELGQIVESLIEKHGLWRVVTAPFLCVSILMTFGLVADTRTAALLAVFLSFLTFFAVIVALGAQLRRERRRRSSLDRAVTQLTETVLAESPGDAYVWEQWSERVNVSTNGDTTIEQWRTLRVSEGASLRVVWTGLQQTTGTVTERQRRNITVRAFDYSEKDGKREVGVQYDLVTGQRSGGRSVRRLPAGCRSGCPVAPAAKGSCVCERRRCAG